MKTYFCWQSNFKLEEKTLTQYDSAVLKCRNIFEKKTIDYGTSWRILRPSSLTDQIFIKAKRIKTIEETNLNVVGDTLEDEYIGIYNYCIIAIIQLNMDANKEAEMTNEEVLSNFDMIANETRELMIKKNTDYGEAWREMRINTYTDMILMKLLRIRQIEDNKGQTLISEGLEANYRDMMNYAIFAIIRLQES